MAIGSLDTGVVQYPSSQNTFVRTFQASGRLQVDYSRNIRDFDVNQYVQIQPVTAIGGLFRISTVEEAARLINSNLNDKRWADGSPRPKYYDGTESSGFASYRCERYAFGATLGNLTIDQADWSQRDEYASKKAQQAMTARTLNCITALTTTGNWDTNHFGDPVTKGFATGKWSASTVARQDIKNSLNAAANQTILDTLGAVNVNDLVLVLSPNCARLISACQEIVDHIKGSPDALAQVRGELPGRNAIFGLPDRLYGFPVIVEKTVRVTSRKGATRAVSYVMPDATPVMVARPGGLMGVFGGPSFATCVMFMFEEMTTEILTDIPNRLTDISIVEQYDVKLVAQTSGYLFQNVV
jgi:hypothetical protein